MPVPVYPPLLVLPPQRETISRPPDGHERAVAARLRFRTISRYRSCSANFGPRTVLDASARYQLIRKTVENIYTDGVEPGEKKPNPDEESLIKSNLTISIEPFTEE